MRGRAIVTTTTAALLTTIVGIRVAQLVWSRAESVALWSEAKSLAALSGRLPVQLAALSPAVQ
jgi:hypothetical protein